MTLFLTQLQLCAPLFILVLAGWILRKARFFGDETASALNAFTFRFLMPAMLFHLLSDLSEMPPVDPWVLGAYFGSCIIVFFLDIEIIKAFIEPTHHHSTIKICQIILKITPNIRNVDECLKCIQEIRIPP